MHLPNFYNHHQGRVTALPGLGPQSQITHNRWKTEKGMSNQLCEALGIQYPIILGGLSRIGTAPLIAAVGNAGGVGMLGAGRWDGEKLLQQINQVRSLSDKPFGVNIPIYSDHSEHLVDIVIREGIPVVTTSAGNPRRFTATLKEHGVFVIQVVSTAAYAVTAEEAGVDAIVAEGSESGGMTGLEEISTMVLVPQVVDSVKCPVLAAGGIGDGRGLSAAMALGAIGVQMGTAFLAAEECEIAPIFKEMLVMAQETDTYLMRRDRSSSRMFKAKFHESALKKLVEVSSETSLEDIDTSLTGAGQISGMIKNVRPAKEIIDDIMRQAAEILPRVSEQVKSL